MHRIPCVTIQPMGLGDQFTQSLEYFIRNVQYAFGNRQKREVEDKCFFKMIITPKKRADVDHILYVISRQYLSKALKLSASAPTLCLQRLLRESMLKQHAIKKRIGTLNVQTRDFRIKTTVKTVVGYSCHRRAGELLAFMVNCGERLLRETTVCLAGC